LADDQEDKKRINVPEIVHSKWDGMLAPYNSIIAKLNSYPQTASFGTRRGIVVDMNDFASRMQAVLFKLSWAAKSLEYMTEFYGKYTGSLEDSMRGMAASISDTFIFNADEFFCFAYSALDIVAGIVDLLVETGIEKRNVYFTTVVKYLAGRSPFTGPVFSELKTKSDSGWINEFRQYRVFVTHHAITQPRSHFRYTATDRKTEINLFVLPDDPRKIPPTYEKKRELVPYCQEVLVKELDVMKVLFEFAEILF
jgi:hypothetical protein